MLTSNVVAESIEGDKMDKEKTIELLRLLSTDLVELADAIDASFDPDTDENVRGLWEDVSETMNSVFAVMASEEEFDAKMEELVQKQMEESPQMSREEAEQSVLQDMEGEDDESDEEDL
jgi:hypothetical protein